MVTRRPPSEDRSRARRATPWLLAAALLLAVAVREVPQLAVGVLYLAPALLLLVPMALGRYVGEERLARIKRSVSPRWARLRAVRSIRRRTRTTVAIVRGGRLVGSGFAVRPPPGVPAA